MIRTKFESVAALVLPFTLSYYVYVSCYKIEEGYL